jgi:hypothetical protein
LVLPGDLRLRFPAVSPFVQYLAFLAVFCLSIGVR